MNKKEAITVMDKFIKFDVYEDVESFVKKYLNKAQKLNKKPPRKGTSDDSIEVFIENANFLKNYESTVLRKINAFHFTKNNIQYYMLKKSQLIGYLGFRTQVRNGVAPTMNKLTVYLILYLMEIVNGVYGETYDEKRVMLDKTLFLAPKKKGYNEAIAEAYEILYLQYSNELELTAYQKGVSLPVFKNFEFVDKNYNNVYKPTADHIFKEIGAYLTGSYDKDDKSLLKAGFDYVYYELNIDRLYEINGQTIEEIFEFESETLVDAPLNNIKALYPSSTCLSFLDGDKVFHSIENGKHSKEIYFYSYRRKILMEYVLETLMKSLKKFCNNYDYNYDYEEFDEGEEIAAFKANIFGNYDPEEMQQLVDNAVERWVSTDSEFLRNICAFNFEVIDYWIKDNKFDPKTLAPRKGKKIKSEKKTNNTKELKESDISQSDIKKFVKRLNELEFGVICIFLDLSQNVKRGYDTRTNPFLLVKINSINQISSKIFGENIIQKNRIVAKYKKLLMKELMG